MSNSYIPILNPTERQTYEPQMCRYLQQRISKLEDNRKKSTCEKNYIYFALNEGFKGVMQNRHKLRISGRSRVNYYSKKSVDEVTL